MTATFKLNRLRQCAKCPWKKSTNPCEIPHGYSTNLHRSLSGTIAKPGDLSIILYGGEIRTMSCHEHPIGEEAHCIGWLANQLGAGNNIPLRLQMRHCGNIGLIELDGEQHACFEDTLP